MKGWIIFLVLLLSAVLGNYLFYVTDRDLEVIGLGEIFPKQIDGWEGEDLQLRDYVYRILGSRNVLSRRYVRDGREIFLSVVASNRDRRVVHPPDVCLKGGGERVVSKEVVSLKRGLKVNQLTLARGSSYELVWYVYALGNDFYTNYYWYQTVNLINNLLGKSKRSYLIRITFLEGDRPLAEDFWVNLIDSVKGKL